MSHGITKECKFMTENLQATYLGRFVSVTSSCAAFFKCVMNVFECRK